jgi:signal transduction histidine kinase
MFPMDGLAWWLLLLVPGAAGVTLWITRREQRLAAEMRQARGELQALADTLDVWQWRTDAEHRLVRLRPPPGAEASAWARAGSALPLLWEAFATADDVALQARLASHAPLDDIDVMRPHADGERQPARLRGRACTDAQGGFAGYIGTLRDGTATVPASAPLVAVTASPESSDHEAFSYTVSHDLRAPIRVVEGFTKILKEDYGRLLDRIGNDHLDRVLGAAARMNAMIDALLALARLSSQPLAAQPVNLSQLAGYVADDLRRQWPERPVLLHVEPGLQAQGDPTLLRVVLENLLGNAWKYTGKCSAPEVWFERDAAPGGERAFTVRDNGAGFDMRFADRLFGVFQRLHSASEFQGTGVGLASVRRIVRRHGGEIWAEAEVDQGATFHFTLR